MTDRAKIDVLVRRKKELLASQKTLVDEFNSLLTQKGEDDGAIETSRKICKNLEAAIATSKQAGDFKYYKCGKLVTEMEERGTLNKLTAQIKTIEEEITGINEEVVEIERARRKEMVEKKPPMVGSISEWFATYGRPGEIQKTNGLASEFKPNTKVYGGTSQFKSFKSVAVTLKRGRLTR